MKILYNVIMESKELIIIIINKNKINILMIITQNQILWKKKERLCMIQKMNFKKKKILMSECKIRYMSCLSIQQLLLLKKITDLFIEIINIK